MKGAGAITLRPSTAHPRCAAKANGQFQRGLFWKNNAVEFVVCRKSKESTCEQVILIHMKQQ
jgi:hypothetical protein